MKSSIVHFYEFSIKKSDLSGLSHDEVAAVGALSQICNELNVFSNLLSLCHEPDTRDKPITFAANLQHHVLLRNLSSHVFEAIDFLKEVVDYAKDSEIGIMQKFSEASAKIENLQLSGGHAINRNIRNEIAFHYKFSVAKKNAKSLPKDADSSVYVNELDGNSYFVLGESLMFFERLKRHSNSDKKLEDAEALSAAWLEWTLHAVRLIKDLQSEVFGLILDHLAISPRKTHYFVDPSYVANSKSGRLPVFCQAAPK